MARIDLKSIAHSYLAKPRSPADYALRPLNHTWEDGGAYALLGPSGCGKTTLLNIISGLLQPTEGRVLFDGEDVTEKRTEERNIAQVFQFPVIYDTMTVFDNLAFPLRNRRFDETAIRARVSQVADMLELTDSLKHRARGLTADAKQRISLGRGLVRSDVAAILFDEPLTVIDPHLKWLLRRKLKQIHESLRLTLVYVTHDQNEALTFADKVVVMSDGAVLQIGSPQDLFERPAHVFVGHFIGSPGMNVFPCALDGDCAIAGETRIPLATGLTKRAREMGGELQLGVRPEFLRLVGNDQAGAAPVVIETVEDLGNFKLVGARLGATLLKVKVAEDEPVVSGPGFIAFPATHTKLYAGGHLVD